jgi:hypothetical protein
VLLLDDVLLLHYLFLFTRLLWYSTGCYACCQQDIACVPVINFIIIACVPVIYSVHA